MADTQWSTSQKASAVFVTLLMAWCGIAFVSEGYTTLANPDLVYCDDQLMSPGDECHGWSYGPGQSSQSWQSTYEEVEHAQPDAARFKLVSGVVLLILVTAVCAFWIRAAVKARQRGRIRPH